MCGFGWVKTDLGLVEEFDGDADCAGHGGRMEVIRC